MSLSKSAGPRVSIKSHVTRHRGALAASAILAILATAAAMVPYIVVFAIATELFTTDSPDPGHVLTLALAALAAVLLRALFSGLSNHLGHVSAYRILRDLRLSLITKLDRMPPARVRARGQGELKKTLHDDVEKLEEGLAHGIPDIASATTVPLVSAVILLIVDWRLGLLTIATVPVVFFILGLGMKKSQANEQAEKQAALRLNTSVLAYLRGMRVIRGFLGPGEGTAEVSEAIQNSSRAAQLPVHNGRWPVSCGIAALSLPIVVLVPATTLLYLGGDISIPVVVLFILMGLGFNQPLYRLIGSAAALYWSVALAGQSITALLQEPELEIAARPRQPESFTIEFDNVSFAYDRQPVLHEIDCTLAEGSMTAIVGATGAGKSTLAQLIARFADPQQGTVRIGGVDVRDVDPAALMRIVSLVQQDDYIFDDSIIENIRLGRPGACDDEVRAAADRARVTAFAEELPDGWDTRLGAGGARLSGGQRQRISVARALLKDSPIVILDEATAYLDAENAEAVTAAVAELARGRTVIVVAHRLSAIAGADRILVIEAGRIAAAGSHPELLERSPRYARMWQAYQNTTGWRLESGGDSGLLPSGRALPGSPDKPIAVPADLTSMGFLRQWVTLLGERGRQMLLRQGLWRMIAEGVLRAAPIWVVFVILVSLITGTLTARLAWVASGLLLLALVLRAMALASANRVAWSNAARSVAEIQTLIVDRLLRVPLGFFSRYDTGRLTTLVADEVRRIDFQNTPSMLVATLVQPLVAGTVLFVLDWRMALAALAGVPLFLILIAWGDRIYHRVFATVMEERAQTASALLEHVRGAAVLRAYPDAPQSLRYTAAVDRLRAASVAVSVQASPAVTMGSAALELGFVALILVGSWLFAAGQLPAVTLLVFLVVSLVFYAPLQELGELSGYRRSQQQVARRIAEVWDAPILRQPERAVAPTDSHVRFEHVDFGYDDQRMTLRDVDFTAPAGAVTALVGASGAGKSTLANLVTRFWDVEAGQVRIGGVDVRDLGSAGLVALVTTVYQDVYLFDDTIRANVTLGRRDATEAEVISALEAAQCDFVLDLPEGLDTVVGEDGASLSGGQRQRLSIARALLKDSPVLVLDEAVASVDPDTEARIQTAMSRLSGGRTVLVVAHRLSTVTNAERIVVMDDGRVDGVGTHPELLDSSPVYRRLWAAHERANADSEAAGRHLVSER